MSDTGDSFSEKLIRFFLFTCGVHIGEDESRNKRRRRLHFTIILSAVFVLIAPQFAYLFRHSDNLYETLDCLVYILHAVHDSAVAITFYATRKSFVYILDNMRFDTNSYDDLLLSSSSASSDLKLKMDEKISKTLKKIAFVSYGSYVAIIVMPIFTIISSKEAIDDPERSLIVTAYYPWMMDTRLKFALSYALQLTVVLIMSSCVPSNCVFLYYFSAEIGAQKKLLLAMVRNLEIASKNSAVRSFENDYDCRGLSLDGQLVRNKRFAEEFDRKLRRNIMLCVDFHKRLIRFIEHFVLSYKWIFVLNLLYSTCVFTFNCYLLVAGDSYLPKFVQRVFELLLVFPYFFVYCFIGESFKGVNRELQNSLYNINWHDKSIKFQKIVLFLLTRSGRDLDLHFDHTFVASYAMFATVIRASYTYANFLLNSQR